MAKEITKCEPEDFELEMTTHWSFPKRGDWAPTMQSDVVIGRHIYHETFCVDIQKRMI